MKLPDAAGTTAPAADHAFGPWYPGVQSPLPPELRPLATIFRREHVFTDIAYADELHVLTGLPTTELIAFRPERLALHELLVRITADVSVPDGPRIGDLGINFRTIVRAMLDGYVEPRRDAFAAIYDDVRRKVAQHVAADLDALLAPPSAAPQPSRWAFWKRAAPAPPIEEGDLVLRAIETWQRAAHTDTDPVRRAARSALARVAGALFALQGQLGASRDMAASLATDLACNDAAGEAIGVEISSLIAEAAARGECRLLPPQERPVVMNTKGASAAGKSTIRPLQRTLAGYLGVAWSDFALVSPDIWRKQLIDYGSLGEHYKYAGPLSGDELAIIDRKLDRYMARKAGRGSIPHLLIDRFRFDSFAPDSDEAGSNLLTRFGHAVHLFFLITPPESIVERAWKRGLEVGRYKAVDELLAHAVEAYAGMPQLFFTWVRRADKRVHFEFLDNSVPFGERPRTVAFGWNEVLNVLDVKSMLDIDRFRRIDVDARSPDALYADTSLLAAERNTAFLRACMNEFAEMNFADHASGRIYARFAGRVPVWADPVPLRDALEDADTRAGLAAVAPALLAGALPAPERPTFIVAAEKIHTVGAWAPGA
jgi:hypothetical protein